MGIEGRSRLPSGSPAFAAFGWNRPVEVLGVNDVDSFDLHCRAVVPRVKNTRRP